MLTFSLSDSNPVVVVVCSYKKGVFYFAHAETVVPVLTALGLFNDGFELLAANYRNYSTERRKFCVSHISPFAVNVALVLHENQRDYMHAASDITPHVESAMCNANVSNRSERYMLELLFNESPIKFPFADRLLWPYSEVRRKYAAYIESCHFKRRCSLNPEGENMPVASSAPFRQL